MTITRAQFQTLLEPKLRNIWNDGWPPRPLEYPRFVNIGSSRKAQETDFKMTGLGLMVNKPEGTNVTYVTRLRATRSSIPTRSTGWVTRSPTR